MPKNAIEPPVVNSLLIADRVYRDVGSGKYVIAGVFNRLMTAAPPARLDQLNVFFQLTNASGSFDFWLRIEHAESGEVMFEQGGPMQVDPPDPLRVIQHLVRLNDVLFRRGGKYWIQLLSDEQILAQAPLYVQVIASENTQERSP